MSDLPKPGRDAHVFKTTSTDMMPFAGIPSTSHGKWKQPRTFSTSQGRSITYIKSQGSQQTSAQTSAFFFLRGFALGLRHHPADAGDLHNVVLLGAAPGHKQGAPHHAVVVVPRTSRGWTHAEWLTLTWLWVKTDEIPFWGRCTSHFRTYFSGDWDIHCGYGLLTHGTSQGAKRRANPVVSFAQAWNSAWDPLWRSTPVALGRTSSCLVLPGRLPPITLGKTPKMSGMWQEAMRSFMAVSLSGKSSTTSPMTGNKCGCVQTTNPSGDGLKKNQHGIKHGKVLNWPKESMLRERCNLFAFELFASQSSSGLGVMAKAGELQTWL